MRKVTIIIVILLVGWILVDLLREPAPGLPSFAEREREMGELEQAQRDGRLREDPDRRGLRRSVLQAGERLKDFPCSDALRQDFANAVTPFLRTVIATRDERPVETVRVGDKVLNGTRFLDGLVIQEIERAVSNGLLRSDDLPPELAFIATNSPEMEQAAVALRQFTPYAKCD